MKRVFAGLVLLIVIIAIIVSVRIQRVERELKFDVSLYCPMNEGDIRQYDKLFGKSEVTGLIGNLATVTHYNDSGEVINWEDYIIKSDGVFQKNIINFSSYASLHFEPSIPFSPWSSIVGDTLLINTIEIRNDTTNTHNRVRLEYEIVSIDTITVPAGTFADCIKIQMSYQTLSEIEQYKYDGISNYWFAPGIGLVRFSSEGQTANLVSAQIDGISYPN